MLVAAKSLALAPVIVMAIMLTAVLPLLLTVTFLGELVVWTG